MDFLYFYYIHHEKMTWFEKLKAQGVALIEKVKNILKIKNV